jgi:hypothetical protein
MLLPAGKRVLTFRCVQRAGCADMRCPSRRYCQLAAGWFPCPPVLEEMTPLARMLLLASGEEICGAVIARRAVPAERPACLRG